MSASELLPILREFSNLDEIIAVVARNLMID